MIHFIGYGGNVKILVSSLIVLISVYSFAESKKQIHQVQSFHKPGVEELRLVVLDNIVLNVELHAQAQNIVGFEHKANSETDKKKVIEVYNKLKDPAAVLDVPKAADCKVNQYVIEGEVFENVPGIPQFRETKNNETQESDRREAKVTYSLQCFKWAQLKGLKASVFKTFPDLKQLHVTTTLKDSQPSKQITPKDVQVPGF
jgi:hypothetical protein